MPYEAAPVLFNGRLDATVCNDTNNARILGVLDELIINEKTGKIVDIAIRIESDRNIHVKGAKRNGDLLLVPFAKVEKVGEFIIVTE